MAAMDDTTPWFISAASLLAGGGGLWGWLSNRARLKAEIIKAEAAAPSDEKVAQAAIAKAQAAFQEALSRSTNAFVEQLFSEREARERHITELQRRIATLEDENEQCRGESRNLSQRLDSLVAELRRRGIDLPVKDMPGTFITLEDGRATVMRASGEPTTEGT